MGYSVPYWYSTYLGPDSIPVARILKLWLVNLCPYLLLFNLRYDILFHRFSCQIAI